MIRNESMDQSFSTTKHVIIAEDINRCHWKLNKLSRLGSMSMSSCGSRFRVIFSIFVLNRKKWNFLIHFWEWNFFFHFWKNMYIFLACKNDDMYIFDQMVENYFSCGKSLIMLLEILLILPSQR